MKYSIFLIASIFILIITEGCHKKSVSSNEPQEVVITGQITNKRLYDPNTIAIIINDVASGIQIRFLDDLDEKGNFEIRFKRYYQQEVMLKYFSIWKVFVHPGDSIHIELDAEKLGSDEDQYHALTFSGDAVKENVQLSFFDAWFSPTRKKELVSMVEESRYTPEVYKLYRDSLRNAYHQHANELVKSHKISEPIKSWIYYEIERDYFDNLVTYPMNHRRLNNYPKNWKVPVSYFDFFEGPKFNSGFIVNSDFAESFVTDFFLFYVRNNIRQELIPRGLVKDTTFSDGSTGESWGVENMDSVTIDGINRFTPKGIKQFVLNYYFVMKQRHNLDIKSYEKYLPLINKEITEPFLLANLRKNYTENKELEKTSPQNKRKNIDDAIKNEGTEILKRIIADNKGKVIYIDCWATWCGPCLEELPNSRKLMTELKDENVEFVFLCCNSPEDAARRKVEDLKLAGTHYFLNADQTNYIQKELNFSSYPNYVLIDKKGKIVASSPGNSPGNMKTKKKILALINE